MANHSWYGAPGTAHDALPGLRGGTAVRPNQKIGARTLPFLSLSLGCLAAWYAQPRIPCGFGMPSRLSPQASERSMPDRTQFRWRSKTGPPVRTDWVGDNC